MREGKHLAIIALGSMVYPSLEAAKVLAARGLDCAVINARFAKPLDEMLIKELCAKFKMLVVAEEGVSSGGFGSAVLELASQKNISVANITILGIPDTLIEHGKREELFEKIGLSPKAIAEKIEKKLR